MEHSRLCQKLRRAGLSDKFLKFFEGFLGERDAVVIVSGSASRRFVLCNMVHQGTVLGPYLWNVFFEDVSAAIASLDDFVETKFADDLNASKDFPADAANDEILKDLYRCQDVTHAWGSRNRVAFDPSKEEFVVLDAHMGHGKPFRLLGPIIDTKLLMHDCVDAVYKKAKPKVRRLLRASRFFTRNELVMQCKSHIWGVVEAVTPALYHAAPSVIRKLDRIQESFIEKVGLTEQQAFLWFGLHPLRVRRDIGMLGVLYKCA